MPEPPRGDRPPGRRFAILVAALIVVGVVVGLLIATSGGGNTAASSQSTPASNAPSAQSTPANVTPVFNAATVTVAVLNGTSTYHLARTVASKLTGQGYKQGTVATASNQTLTKTVVAYLPGHRSDAVHVARSLNLSPGAVTAIDPNTKAIACPQPSACNADVVVTAGSDLSNL